MSARGKHIDMHFFRKNPEFSICLNRIYMKIRLRIHLFDQFPDLCNRLYRSDFVIHKHHRYQNRLRTDRFFQFFQRNLSLCIDTQSRHFKSLAFQKFRRGGYCRMFNATDNDMIPLPSVCQCCSDQCPVVGLGSTGGKINFFFLYF